MRERNVLRDNHEATLDYLFGVRAGVTTSIPFLRPILGRITLTQRSFAILATAGEKPITIGVWPNPAPSRITVMAWLRPTVASTSRLILASRASPRTSGLVLNSLHTRSISAFNWSSDKC